MNTYSSRLARAVAFISFPAGVVVDVGAESRAPQTEIAHGLPYEKKAPHAFTGTVKNVVFDLKPEPLEAEVPLHEHAALHAVAAGVAG